MTLDRYKVVEFSKIYLFSQATYITSPPGLKRPVKLILEPFDISVWFSILLALFIVIIIQRLILHKITKDNRSDMSWALISALLKQGYFN